MFRLTDEAGQLDNISRRYAWFRRILGTHEGGLGRAFLPEWKVGWWLLAGFIDITRYVNIPVRVFSLEHIVAEAIWLRCYLKQRKISL